MGTSRVRKKQNLGKFPPRPQEPDPYECCGRGCDPCIYDYYAKRLARWEKRVAEIKASKGKEERKY